MEMEIKELSLKCDLDPRLASPLPLSIYGEENFTNIVNQFFEGTHF